MYATIGFFVLLNSSNLFVSGDISTNSNLKIQNEIYGFGDVSLNSSNLFVSGNTGIGIVPSNKLEVNGNVDLNSSSSNPNKFIGYGTIPIGGIIMWNNLNGETEPDGWALCTGQTVNNHTTPNLKGRFIMSSTYGLNDTGEGNTNYQVINPLGNTGGEQFVTLTNAQMPVHTHPYKDYYAETAHQGTSSGLLKRRYIATQDLDRTTQTAGGGGAHENRPPYYVLAYIMRIR